MINPSIETNLVGEIAEVYITHWRQGDDGKYRREDVVLARGMIRAATTTGHGELMVWIQAQDVHLWGNDFERAVGSRWFASHQNQYHPKESPCNGDIIVDVISSEKLSMRMSEGPPAFVSPTRLRLVAKETP